MGKPTFPCNITALDNRWRIGRPECYSIQSAQDSLGQSVDDDSDDEENTKDIKKIQVFK